MNTFVADKLGEVLAFARVGKDTLAKGREGFLKMFNERKLQDTANKLDKLEQAVLAFADQENVTQAVAEAAAKTQKKVTDMRDEYVDGNWDVASEVLEWMGFYTGASLVHWHLLAGAGKKESAKLQALSEKAIRFYATFFMVDEKALAKIGATEAKK